MLYFKESESVELKASFNDEVIISLTSFVNYIGGVVYVGVRDDGAIKGVELGKETIQNWLNKIKAKTQPAIIPTVKRLEIGEKNCISYPSLEIFC